MILLQQLSHSHLHLTDVPQQLHQLNTQQLCPLSLVQSTDSMYSGDKYTLGGCQLQCLSGPLHVQCPCFAKRCARAAAAKLKSNWARKS